MPQKTKPKRALRPAQTQRPPGIESRMKPRAHMSGQVLHPNGGEIVNG